MQALPLYNVSHTCGSTTIISGWVVSNTSEVTPRIIGGRVIAMIHTMKNIKKQYVTGDSQEITHPSTSPAQTGLSCEF